MFFGQAKAACLCSCCWTCHLWCYDGGRLGRIKIVTLRVDTRVKEKKKGGEGEKKICLPDIIVLWETPYAGKRSPWLVRLRGSRLMPVNQLLVYKLLLFILLQFVRNQAYAWYATAEKNYPEFWLWIQKLAGAKTNFNSAVDTSLLELERLGMSRVSRNEKVKAFSTLVSGQDLLAVLKCYTTFTVVPHAKLYAACSNKFFFSGG